ncbi:hypothetical protein [Novipirellula artificiosorum]|uniref:Uncharacterized protein n=1 Tax=Novipirellula artificiosorum TaxID=2528016 RepID=A0A5C6D4B4_9BACT|nr:hypothetical protein [Novipirellula artificiosorum]TWU31732.1 hypothetical protein Poly41_59670 [Novipirellula artificiosorum]
MSKQSLPSWANQPATKAALLTELSAYLDDVSRLASVANRNVSDGMKCGFCEPEPPLRAPRLVRKLADDLPRLKAAIAASPSRADLDEFLGNTRPELARPKAKEHADHIAALAVASEQLKQLVADCIAVIEKRGPMTAEEIAVEANGILATETKSKRSVPIKNELARRVGCSPNAPTLIKAWDDYRKVGGGSHAKPKSLAIDDGIGGEDKELERLIREQEAEVKADLRMPRGKQRARTVMDD